MSSSVTRQNVKYRSGKKSDKEASFENMQTSVVSDRGGRLRIMTINEEETRTQQQFKDQTDVNKIVAKYKTTREWTHLTGQGGVYADVTQIPDYQTSLQKVIDANNAFGTLPAHLRTRFENDPGRLLAFLQNPKNYDEGVQLGLIQKKAEPINQNELNEKKPGEAKSKKPSEKQADE